jgi:hypothetical protein
MFVIRTFWATVSAVLVLELNPDTTHFLLDSIVEPEAAVEIGALASATAKKIARNFFIFPRFDSSLHLGFT